ncbi:MAG: hypothetical protein COV35_08880 [Alphaproteobacteria bacterium CG11_big_fil_rev_8_21_14_0_20_39_49]|nr:MAG: hypothetical protein COV35_08880 [Alphaproteobacteria bacterium CG11_big_fil_rev_8_21_14_0_20_39_49]
MFRTYIKTAFFTLVLFQIFFSSSFASDMSIENCDELIALDGENSKKMLCWYELDNTNDNFTYSGTIYQDGKFTDLKDGIYDARRHARVFRAENGYVMFHKDRAYLEKAKPDDKDIFAEFYEVNFEGLQRVYICEHDKDKKVNICNSAKDKEYTTRTNVTFETKDGFLPVGCFYHTSWLSEPALICEDLH